MSQYKNRPHSQLTGQIIEIAYMVYNNLGFGFLESVYEKSMEIELKKSGVEVVRQFPIDVYYGGDRVGEFRADLLVDRKVIVEIKAADALHEKHDAQLLNYLRATDIEIGLLINFGEEIKIKRKIFSNHRKK